MAATVLVKVLITETVLEPKLEMYAKDAITGVTVIVAVTALLLVLMAVNEPIFSDPFAARPIPGVSLTQLNVLPVPVKLTAGKKLGFAVSYNDNDATGGRENFIGSINIEPVDGDKNRGWIDAGVFGTLELIR